MNVTEEQKKQMVANLDRSFDLLKAVLDLKLAYLKKIYPGKTEIELSQKISMDVIKAKERQWNWQKI